MRTYLVVMDETEEASLAMRFAARRAAKTGGTVHLIAITEPPAFVAWGGVQATIEAEVRERAEAMLQAAATRLHDDYDIRPQISVRQGEATSVLREIMAEDTSSAALVLAAAATGAPGPLVTHFATSEPGTLPVPLMIVPGGLSEDEIDRLS